MIDRYIQLYSEMKLIEHQLKKQCKAKFGQTIAFKMMSRKKFFIKPEIFKEILGENNGDK